MPVAGVRSQLAAPKQPVTTRCPHASYTVADDLPVTPDDVVAAERSLTLGGKVAGVVYLGTSGNLYVEVWDSLPKSDQDALKAPVPAWPEGRAHVGTPHSPVVRLTTALPADIALVGDCPVSKP
jgi:hypothetical protein